MADRFFVDGLQDCFVRRQRDNSSGSDNLLAVKRNRERSAIGHRHNERARLLCNSFEQVGDELLWIVLGISVSESGAAITRESGLRPTRGCTHLHIVATSAQ